MQVRSLSQEDPPEKGMATHSGIFPWEIPWIEETGRLQSMESTPPPQEKTLKTFFKCVI